MNDPIDELIEKATIRGEVYLPGDDGHPTPTVYFDKRIFAELIVKECAAMAKGFEFAVERDGLSKAMKEHFGVEE